MTDVLSAMSENEDLEYKPSAEDQNEEIKEKQEMRTKKEKTMRDVM
jgi:hypothetical protein